MFQQHVFYNIIPNVKFVRSKIPSPKRPLLENERFFFEQIGAHLFGERHI